MEKTTEYLPYTKTKLSELGKVIAVLDEQDRKDRAEWNKTSYQLHPFVHCIKNSAWWDYIEEKYNIPKDFGMCLTYNENDGMVYEHPDR